MTDEEIIDYLKSGGKPTFGLHGRNAEVMALMADLEARGLIRTEDASLSQETRLRAIWLADAEGLS